MLSYPLSNEIMRRKNPVDMQFSMCISDKIIKQELPMNFTFERATDEEMQSVGKRGAK